MTRQSLSRAAALTSRALRSATTTITRTTTTSSSSSSSSSQRLVLATTTTPLLAVPALVTPAARLLRSFSTSPAPAKGILPHSDDPAPPNVQASDAKAVPAPLTDAEYHEVADAYLEVILSRLEELAEKDEGVDVEYSAGVLNVTFPEIGTYVLNKQPPNKQIWLSSPVSGPKRYDYVVYGEGQAQKEDTAVGDWVYLRDGSTIDELFARELHIALALPLPQ